MLYSFTIVNSAKNYSHEKEPVSLVTHNREVLTTFNIDYNLHIEPIVIYI